MGDLVFVHRARAAAGDPGYVPGRSDPEAAHAGQDARVDRSATGERLVRHDIPVVPEHHQFRAALTDPGKIAFAHRTAVGVRVRPAAAVHAAARAGDLEVAH